MTKFFLFTLAVLCGQFSFSSQGIAAKYNFMEDQKIMGKDSVFTISPLQWESWNDDQLTEHNIKFKYLQVVEYLKENNIEPARTIISDFLTDYPSDTRFIHLKAVLNVLGNDINAAKQDYLRILKLESNNLTAMLGLAKIAVQQREFGKAQQYAQSALAIDDKLSHAYLILADVAEQQDNFEEAENILLKGLVAIEGNLEQELQMVDNLGDLYGKHQQVDKMLPICMTLVKRYPNEIRALSALSVAQLSAKQYTLAEQSLKQIINQAKQDTYHHWLLADLLGNSLNREKEAIELLDQTLQIKSDDLPVLTLLVRLKIKGGQYSSAKDNINKLEGYYPDLAITKRLAGEWYMAQKQYTEAANSFQKVYQIEHNNDILFLLADLMLMQNKQSAALDLLENELQKNNDKIAVHFKLAAIYQQLTNYKQAENHYMSILVVQPDNLLALNNLAWNYLKQNKPEALIMAKKAYELAPESADIADTYGMILLNQNHKKLALAMIKKAAASKSESNDIQYHLALAHKVNGNNSQAIQILKKIETSKQDFAEKLQAIDLLKNLTKEGSQ